MSSFQHLVYTKTASIDLSEISLENIFIETYGGLFLSGYIPEELNDFPKNTLIYLYNVYKIHPKYKLIP